MSDFFTQSDLPTPDLTTTLSNVASVPTDTNGYIALPVTVDPNQLTSDAFGFIQEQIPGWVPQEGHLESWLIEACARMVSTYAQVAAQVPVSVFAYLGGQLLGVPPNLGASAEVTTTWTMVDNRGYTIPAGTVIGFATSGNTLVQFQTTADFTIPAGSTATDPGAITVTAVAAGTAANGIAAGDMVMVTSLAFVASVESTAVTAGGADPETMGVYLNRLSQQLKLLSPRPVLAPDYAIIAQQQPGVARALALDNTDPYANMLSADDASFEGGIGTWAPVTNCTVSQYNGWGADGTHSLAVKATASGAATARTGWYAVSPGVAYTAVALFHAASVAATCGVTLVWADINFNVLTTFSGATGADSTSGGVQRTVSDEAPAAAAYVAVQAIFTAASANETHDLDEAALFLGSGTTWSPGGQMTSQERSVTVIPVDADGDPLTASQMSAIRQTLNAMRETNFEVYVVPPTYTAVAVNAAVVTVPGADIDAVSAAVTAALHAYLDPGAWAGGGQQPPQWLNDTTVRYLVTAGVIQAVVGVQYISSLTINGDAADCPLNGYAPLPQPTINVSVTAGITGT